jgi:hypothetical protein
MMALRMRNKGLFILFCEIKSKIDYAFEISPFAIQNNTLVTFEEGE